MIYNISRPRCVNCGKIFKKSTSDLLTSSKNLRYCSSNCEDEDKGYIPMRKQTDPIKKKKGQIVMSTTDSAKEIRKYSKLKNEGVITEEELISKRKDIMGSHSRDPQIGQIFDGVVTKLMDFGAFVEYAPGCEGLVHISEMEWGRVEKVEDVCKPGDKMKIKLIKIDDKGKLGFSRKDLLPKPDGYTERSRNRRDIGDGEKTSSKKRRF